MADALDATLERVAAARAGGFGLQVARRDAPGDGWIEAVDLWRDDGPLDELIDGVARLAATEHRHIGAQWLFEHSAWQAAALVSGTLMADARVPSLEPANVLLAMYDGSLWGIAVRGGRVLGLEGDSGADIVVPDERALARAAHTELVTHLAPLADAIVARRLRSAKPLWQSAGDRVGQAMLWCAQAFDDEPRARRLAELVVAPPSPMHVPIVTKVGDDGEPFHVRASCCLNHRTPDASLCAGCPRLHPKRHPSRAR